MLKQILEKMRQFGESEVSDTDHLVAIAAATLLMEVAWADHHISDTELATIRQKIKEQFALDDKTLDAILEESRNHQDNSVGLQSFTRTITEAWDESSRYQLVVAMWELAESDDGVHHFEEHMIRKIADLLYVSHARFIEAKLQTQR